MSGPLEKVNGNRIYSEEDVDRIKASLQTEMENMRRELECRYNELREQSARETTEMKNDYEKLEQLSEEYRKEAIEKQELEKILIQKDKTIVKLAEKL